MYEHLLVAIDNSKYSAHAATAAVALAQRFEARLTGVHVTNPGLHGYAFRMLERTLPERYQDERVLEQQRTIHESLIRRGLTLISDSYLEQLRAHAAEAGVPCSTKVLEGRHYEAQAEEIERGDYQLAVFGHLGLGAGTQGTLGGVVERVARRIRKDMLVVKDGPFRAREERRTILVAVDGSDCSFAALRKALVLAGKFDAQVHAIHVFDPDFHRTIFRELVGVLTAEAAAVFDFESQQALHDTVIDKGLERVGGKVLRGSELAAEQAGVPLTTALLRGKFCEEIVRAAARLDPMLIIVGRFGKHRVESSDLGSTAENVLRFAPCSVLLAGTEMPAAAAHRDPAVEEAQAPLGWTPQAEAMIGRAPDFVRSMARATVEAWVRERGLRQVDVPHVQQAMKELLPEKMRHGIIKEA
jgi:nucleotide-binding universal stress UspA family protein